MEKKVKFGELDIGAIFSDGVFEHQIKIGYHTAEDDEEVNAVDIETGITHWWCDDEEVIPLSAKCLKVFMLDDSNGKVSRFEEE